MTVRYAKTETGRDEIRARAHALSRPARNLLLCIDGTRTGSDWLGLVGGSTEADLDQLVAQGLVGPAPGSVAGEAPRGPTLQEALQLLSYRELYDRLTAQARQRFGLIKGYRTVLEIERCAGADEIRALAVRFVADVRAAQGEAAARALARELGAEL